MPLARVLEVGFGESPVTAVEFRDRLEETNPSVEFLAVDTEPSRVERAGKVIEAARVEGFELPGSDWDLIRAMNVLRAYQPDEVSSAWKHWSSKLSVDGVLIEGTTDPEGHLASVVEIGSDTRPTRLVFMTDFERGFAPIMFRDWLPRRWRRGLAENDPVYVFLRSWQDDFRRLHRRGDDARTTFERLAPRTGCDWYMDSQGAYLEWPFEKSA